MFGARSVAFLAYVNDLPQLVSSKLVMFVDDIKMWTRVDYSADSMLLQRDLNALYD